MSSQLLRADLTRLHCDAIVIPADTTLQNGGSVFGAERCEGRNSEKSANRSEAVRKTTPNVSAAFSCRAGK